MCDREEENPTPTHCFADSFHNIYPLFFLTESFSKLPVFFTQKSGEPQNYCPETVRFFTFTQGRTQVPSLMRSAEISVISSSICARLPEIMVSLTAFVILPSRISKLFLAMPEKVPSPAGEPPEKRPTKRPCLTVEIMSFRDLSPASTK